MHLTQKSRSLLGSLTVLWLSFVGGATSTAQTGVRNMLWRVQSDSTVVYLLGSVHMLPKSMYPLAAPIEHAFDSAQRVVFELNLDSVNQFGASMSMLQLGMYDDGRTLKGSISKATYALLQKRARKLGYDMAMLSQFKPWMVAFMLMGLDAQGGGFEAQYGIDMYFHGKASKAGKHEAGLETIEDQVGIFANLDDVEQEKFLKQMLDNKRGGNELDVIVKAWKQGDPAPLIKLLDQYLTTDSALYESMLFQRNRNWIPQIETLLKGHERTLVIVGTLHLVGDRGVVAMLRQKGYTVEQL